MTATREADLPGHVLEASRMPGHWLLARLGKRVLRPGGVEITEQLLAATAIGSSDDVVEVAPGLGATTRRILAAGPASYTGVDRDPAAADLVATMLDGPHRRVAQASASRTGLPDQTVDVGLGEAYLKQQPDLAESRIDSAQARL